MEEYKLNLMICEDITKIIKEELGIADEVKNTVNIIYDRILQDSKNIEKEIIEDGTSLKYNYFAINDIFGNKLTVYYYIYNFVDKSFRKAFIRKEGENYLDSGSRHIYRNIRNIRKLIDNSVIIKIESISGIIQNVPNIKDTIQHELEHIYQQTKMEKEFGSADLNSFIMSKLYSNDIYEKNIAEALYMTFKSEIEGFSNGLYAFLTELMKNGYGVGSLNIAFRKSEAFKKLQNAYKTKEYIEKHQNEPEVVKAIEEYNRFGITKDNIIEKIDDAIKEMNTRFGKAMIKAKKDYNEMGGLSDMIEKLEFKPY